MWSEISSNPVMITLLLIAVLGLGELISIWTKARIPMLLAALLIYVGLLWAGIIPNGLMSDSVITALDPELLLHSLSTLVHLFLSP